MRNEPTSRDERRLQKDERTVVAMAQLYCRGHHASEAHDERGLCPACAEAVDYAAARTRACPNQHRGTCDTCTIQCYRPAMRSAIRTIMAYSGPRILFHHPLMALRHLVKKAQNRT